MILLDGLHPGLQIIFVRGGGGHSRSPYRAGVFLGTTIAAFSLAARRPHNRLLCASLDIIKQSIAALMTESRNQVKLYNANRHIRTNGILNISNSLVPKGRTKLNGTASCGRKLLCLLASHRICGTANDIYNDILRLDAGPVFGRITTFCYKYKSNFKHNSTLYLK